MSQNANIAKALKRGQRLTAMEALHRWGTFRLASRVNELRRSGHNIVTDMVVRNGKRIARYRLA